MWQYSYFKIYILFLNLTRKIMYNEGKEMINMIRVIKRGQKWYLLKKMVLMQVLILLNIHLK